MATVSNNNTHFQYATENDFTTVSTKSKSAVVFKWKISNFKEKVLNVISSQRRFIEGLAIFVHPNGSEIHVAKEEVSLFRLIKKLD